MIACLLLYYGLGAFVLWPVMSWNSHTYAAIRRDLGWGFYAFLMLGIATYWPAFLAYGLVELAILSYRNRDQ